jgi:succinate dehydrogenase / fumarate reductase, cytochrome b subunit
VQWFFGSPIGYLILFGYTWILMHHMLGGVRHLVWDFGYGMEADQRIAMARFTLIGSVALTLAIWVVAFIAF